MNGDIKKVRDNYFKMQKYLLILNLAISLPLIIFAPLIIKIVFGEAYLDAVVPFRLLSVGYFIVGSFRIPAGNIILSMKKVKINFYNALISGILNIILDVVLILKYGVIGAATATVIIFVISSLISNGYLFIYFKQK
jgi:O-antigen/teichoic acid export membrane protein